MAVFDVRTGRFTSGGSGRGRFTRTRIRRVFDVRTGRFTTTSVVPTAAERQARASLIGRGISNPTQAEIAAQASLIDRGLEGPTPAEIAAQASLVDRGPPRQRIIRTETRVQAPVGAASRVEKPESVVFIGKAEKEALQPGAIIRRPTPRKAVREDRNIFEDIRTSLVGRPGTEQKGIPFTGRGGVFQRTQTFFFGPLRAGTEFGEAVGGKPGRVVGAVAGGAVGGVLGILEGGLGTALTLGFEKPVERLLRLKGVKRETAETAGQLVGGIAGFISLPRAGAVTIGRLAKGTGQIARQTPRALLAAESFVGRGRSIFAPPTVLGRAATGTQALIGGVERGLAGGTIASIYLGRAARAGTIGGRVLRVGGQAVKRPAINIPLLFGGALVAPEVAERVAVAGTTQQFRERIVSTQKGQRALDLVSAEVRKVQASRGIVAQIGGELSLGVLESRERIGGISTADVRKAAKTGLISAGFTPSEAAKFAPEAAVLFKARQIGGIAGFTGISIGTEVVGAKTIGPIIERGLIGQLVKPGGPKAFRKTLKVVAPTLPRFAALGAIEGVETVAISDIAQRRARGVRELPKRIVKAPAGFLLGGAFGAASAVGLGGLAVGGGIFRAFRGGKSALGRGVEAGALSAGFVTDVFEKAGDDIAKFFGKVEPRLRIRTVGIPGITETGRVSARTRAAIPAGIFVPTSIIERAPAQVPTQVPPITPTTTEPIIGFVPDIPIPSLLEDFIETPEPVKDITQQIQENIPISSFIGISTPIGVPVSKAGFPLLFPAAPFGGGRGRGRGARRKTFFNEFAFARGVLGAQLARRGQQISRERRSLFGIGRPRRRKRSKSRGKKK